MIMLLASLAGVLGVLVAGLLAMAQGGDINRKYGNRLMQARVLLQGISIVLFVLVMISASS